MKTGLLSIHDRFATRIFDGSKRYEFRRRAPDVELPTRFLIYVPGRRRLAGEIVVEFIHRGSPTAIWEQTKTHAGITRREYREYFAGRATACALEVKSFVEYEKQASLDALRMSVPGGFYPPQYLRWLPTEAVSVMRPPEVAATA